MLVTVWEHEDFKVRKIEPCNCIYTYNVTDVYKTALVCYLFSVPLNVELLLLYHSNIIIRPALRTIRTLKACKVLLSRKCWKSISQKLYNFLLRHIWSFNFEISVFWKVSVVITIFMEKRCAGTIVAVRLRSSWSIIPFHNYFARSAKASTQSYLITFSFISACATP